MYTALNANYHYITVLVDLVNKLDCIIYGLYRYNGLKHCSLVITNLLDTQRVRWDGEGWGSGLASLKCTIFHVLKDNDFVHYER